MDFAFSEEQEQLRKEARSFLAKECTPAFVRAVMETDDAHDRPLWKKLAEIGWTSLGIPEQYGGFGSFLDLSVVLEEAGRVLLPGPYFATMGLAVPALIEAGTEPQKRAVLTAIAAGEATATLAVAEASGRWDPASIGLRATPSGEGWKLDGAKHFVPDAAAADHIVVAARTGGAGEDGISLFLVSGRPAGLNVRPMGTLDRSRQWYEVEFHGVELPSGSLMGVEGRGWIPLRRVLEWGAAALSTEMVGGMQWILETSVAYAKTRHQFGRPIGVFQAVSHKLADMLLQTESARSAAIYAAWTVDADAPDRSLACSAAKAYNSDAYRAAAGSGVQVHGGIGFTWEHDMHLYFKRAKGSEVLLGDATYHRELIAQEIDL